jgi:hypothetical protein
LIRGRFFVRKLDPKPGAAHVLSQISRIELFFRKFTTG